MTEASSAPQQPAAAPAASAANPAAQPAASASGSSLSKLTAPLSEARQAIENLKDSANYASDAAIKSTTQALAVAISMGLQQFNETRKVACQLWKEGQAYVDSGVAQIKQAEDAAVSSIKSSVATAAALPAYCTYPAIGLGTLLLLPATRRAMYNATIGRLRSPEAIAKTSAGRVEGLKTKLEEVSGEAQKLSERMRAAEEEMRRGAAALRDTRLAMQRLASTVSKSERSAQAVLYDLRRIKKLDNTSALRAEAASQLAAFKNHQSQLQKYIRRIASQDV